MEAPRFEAILTTFDDILRKIVANELLELDLRGNDVIVFFFFFFLSRQEDSHNHILQISSEKRDQSSLGRVSFLTFIHSIRSEMKEKSTGAKSVSKNAATERRCGTWRFTERHLASMATVQHIRRRGKES
jgi:hypothetical protein